jgi:hypothetical protein
MDWNVRVSCPGAATDSNVLLNIQPGPGDHPTSYSIDMGGGGGGFRPGRMKLTTHLHLVSGFRMNGI